MELGTIYRGRWIRLLLLLVVVAAIPGVWGPWTGHAAGMPAPVFWEPEYEGLRNPDPEVRAETVRQISVTRDQNAVPVLLLYLGDPDQRVGLYMAQTLGNLAEEDALAVLRMALGDPDPNIRWRAAMALGEQGDAAAVPRLGQLLQDPDKLVQNVAANALTMIGTREAIDALTAGLGSTQPSTARNTMNGLLKLGGAAVPALASILGSGNTQARLNAATVLGYIADPRAAPALRQAAADPDADVRAEVQWALGEITKTTKK